jgi:hypothetical protein
MPPAQHLVCDLLRCVTACSIRNRDRVADDDLITHEHHLTVHRASIVSRPLAAPAQSPYLKNLDAVTQLN